MLVTIGTSCNPLALLDIIRGSRKRYIESTVIGRKMCEKQQREFEQKWFRGCSDCEKGPDAAQHATPDPIAKF
jgi:hypothetical protein